MRSEYFGLIMNPFESGPDPRFFYMDPARRSAFAQLLASVFECKGLVLLACERGLGKSTLIRHLADQLAALDSALMLYPGGVLNCRSGMSFADILAACRGRFDRSQPSRADEDRLRLTLERAAERSQVVVLLLDDADALDDAALLRLRELSDLDGEDRRQMSVILVGSPRLALRLQRLADAEGAAGLVDLALDLPPLRDRDVDRLVRHRLAVAGHGEGDLFSPVALADVARRSRGYPGRVNALCETAMGLAEREMKSTVSRDHVERAAADVEDFDEEDAERLNERWRVTAAPKTVAAAPLADQLGGEPVHEGSPRADASRRLDDVAEAIRAADMRSGSGVEPPVRSSGDVDPHIKFGPAFPRQGLEPEQQGAEGYARPGADTRPADAGEWRAAGAASASDDRRFYAGVRPSETHRPRKRAWLVPIAIFGLILALLVAGGIYASRAGLLEVDRLAERAGLLATKVAHLVSEAVKPEPAIDESSPGIMVPRPNAGDAAGLGGADPSPGALEDPQATGFGFDRFGSGRPGPGAVATDEAPGDGSYDFAPPPPQAPAPPPQASRRSGEGAIAAGPNVSGPAQASQQRPAASASPIVPAPDLPVARPAQPAQPAATFEAPQPADAAVEAEAANAPPPPTAGSAAGSLLDPGTAVVLSRRGPPETAKPTPPPQPGRPAAAQPAPETAAAAPGPASPASSPAPPAAPAAPGSRDAQPQTRQTQYEPLLARGDEYLVTADLDMARTFYQMAYERGSPEAAVRLGWTFDPQYFQRAGIRGEASPREAILWYQEARRRGSGQASERLSALATWLQSAAASGDVEAQRILRLWQG